LPILFSIFHARQPTPRAVDPAMAAAEMHPLVEDEDEEVQNQPAKRKWWDPATYDWGKLLSYRTTKVVRIRDSQLGTIYWCMVTSIIMYSIIFVFNMEGRHTEQATGTGTASAKFRGKGFSGDKVYDTADLRFPVVEPSGAFIMTRRIMVKSQRLGNCVDWDSPVKCPCKGNSTCRNGFCQRRGWCPSLGDYNTKSLDVPDGADQEVILGLEDSVLNIASSISFPSIGNTLFVTGDTPDSTNLLKDIRLGDLLALTSTSMEEVQKRGALISIALLWRCDVAYSRYCEPNTLVKRLDNGQGFVQKRAKIRRDENGEEVRDATYDFGVRVLVDCSGVGRRVSMPLIVVQIGSCISLLRVAMFFTDFLMLVLYPITDRRLAYKQCKITETQDYSDLQERLNLIKDQGEREVRSAKQGKNRQSQQRGRSYGSRLVP